jgi:hypothetical protein
MSGGLALIDYDKDGYPDIYFVNSLTADLVKSKGKTKSSLPQQWRWHIHRRNGQSGVETSVGAWGSSRRLQQRRF